MFLLQASGLAVAAIIALLPATASAECGTASWYGLGFHGLRTASGQRYDMHGISAAHKTLPFGTRVLVRNQRTGRTIIVPITDRGPYVAGRSIDLSLGAKKALGMGHLAPVCIYAMSNPTGRGAASAAGDAPEG